MLPLAKALRNDLEKTVKSARDIAENAAKACLEQLGVGEAAPFSHLSDVQKDLRRRLRAHGRQLGDNRSTKGEQEIARLVEEVAYEHWHRMLFARFLAENNLLMFDGVAVTLQECAELADEEGFANEWELAANLAGAMLPQIFRTDSVVFKLHFSPEHQRSLERLIVDLPAQIFTASDSLGWVYQFWQSKRKEEVNASEVKIGARELPAVTQLFTEPYMVSFLLDNSLGAWWAAKRLTEDDLQNACSEEELRRKVAIPGVPLYYLRFVKQENGTWTPAAGTFDGWPEQLAELKILDPCCGSGHFLVAAVLMLVPMRMERDDLSAKDAVDAVLQENIHGLELDQRCVELAAFALALSAWKYPTAGGYRVLPELNLACSGLTISAKKEEWLALAGDNTNLRIALEELYKQFKDAPVLGSLINPETSLGKGSLFELKWEEVGPLITKAFASEKDAERAELGVVARKMATTITILQKNHHLVLTNVPYLSTAKQTDVLRLYCDKYFPNSKNDIATVFLERSFKYCSNGGASALVIPQNWLFLKKYKKFREHLLSTKIFNMVTLLGSKSFQTPMWDFNVQLIILSNTPPLRGQKISGIDVSKFDTPESKASNLCTNIAQVLQSAQRNNPDSSIALIDYSETEKIGDYANCYHGITTTDLVRFSRQHWESQHWSLDWVFQQGTCAKEHFYGGKESVLFWQNGTGDIKNLQDQGAPVVITGLSAWEKRGISINRIGQKISIYNGSSFDTGVAVLIPHKEIDLVAIYAYCQSKEFIETINNFNQSLAIEYNYFPQMPIDFDKWKNLARTIFPNGLPKPHTNEPSQWIFHGHPCGSVRWDEEKKWTTHAPLRIDETVLHVSVARLLGYRWPAELDSGMELANEQCEWVKRCDALASYVDDDGIVCIPPVRGEAPATDRLLNLLAAAYGDTWSNDLLSALLKSAGHAGKTLETWLREKFFTQHCKLFQHRPFIWHIWDGLRDGFAALVNYHRLDFKNLETLTYTYLGDWITRQKQDITNGVDGAAEKLAAAETLKKSLELILEGEKPYDIFVRWKPIDKQPIGWNPDLNDGVRLNIRPFMTVPDVAKKGAGILRDKPNIKWDKDRGKDVESAPWFPVFKGDRINDHHLNLAEKRAARQQPIDNL